MKKTIASGPNRLHIPILCVDPKISTCGTHVEELKRLINRDVTEFNKLIWEVLVAKEAGTDFETFKASLPEIVNNLGLTSIEADVAIKLLEEAYQEKALVANGPDFNKLNRKLFWDAAILERRKNKAMQQRLAYDAENKREVGDIGFRLLHDLARPELKWITDLEFTQKFELALNNVLHYQWRDPNFLDASNSLFSAVRDKQKVKSLSWEMIKDFNFSRIDLKTIKQLKLIQQELKIWSIDDNNLRIAISFI